MWRPCWTISDWINVIMHRRWNHRSSHHFYTISTLLPKNVDIFRIASILIWNGVRQWWPTYCGPYLMRMYICVRPPRMSIEHEDNFHRFCFSLLDIDRYRYHCWNSNKWCWSCAAHKHSIKWFWKNFWLWPITIDAWIVFVSSRCWRWFRKYFRSSAKVHIMDGTWWRIGCNNAFSRWKPIEWNVCRYNF